MAYLTITDDALLSKLDVLQVTLDTDITIDAVNDMIVDVESDVNGALRNAGYSAVPVTNAADVHKIKRAVSEMVGVLIWEEVTTNAEMPANVKNWQARFAKFLETGILYLQGDEPESTAAGRVTVSTITFGSQVWTDDDLRSGQW